MIYPVRSAARRRRGAARRRRPGLGTFALAVLAALAGQLQPVQVQEVRAQAPVQSLSPEQVETLRAAVQARLDELWTLAQDTEEVFPGATAAVILPDGQVLAFATGFSDVERGIEMHADMRMPSGSIGKTYVAATAISMALDGTLSLDDPISKWLGDEPWFDRLPNGSDITLRHLLNHSGGLIDHALGSEAFAAAVSNLVRGDPNQTLTPRELIEFALDQEPLFPAGLGYNYTDTGYIVAGLVLEAASGGTYYEELRRRLLEPLALDMTHPQDRRDAPRLAQGYAVASSQLFGLPGKVVADGRLVFHPGIEWTGGGLYNNPQAMVRWAKLLYEGDALDGDYLGDLLESAVRGASAGPGVVYSLGVFIAETPFGVVYGHGGFFPGYNSRVMYSPDYQMAIALQINADETRTADHIAALAGIVVDALASR